MAKSKQGVRLFAPEKEQGTVVLSRYRISALLCDQIVADPNTEYLKPDDLSEDDWQYIVGVLKAKVAGELSGKKLIHLHRRGQRLIGWGVPERCVDSHEHLDPQNLVALRAIGQTQGELEALWAEVVERWEKRRGHEPLPRQQPAPKSWATNYSN